MRPVHDIRSAVVGTGFIGVVHAETLRRLGVSVLGLVGSTPERVRASTQGFPHPSPYQSFGTMLEDRRVEVVHLATPNRYHYAQAKACLEAGKHVVCEKPLAMTAAQSAELVELAERKGLVQATCFNVRFYPQVQEARFRIQRGDVGTVWNIHGAYLQDWLLYETDWNWRLDPGQAGLLRAGHDIGSHWLDLVQFVAGQRVESVLADLATTVPVRQRPTGPVRPFVSASPAAVPAPTEPVEMRTDDVANLLLAFEGGARGSVVLSQVSAGRRNQVRFEVYGPVGGIAWDSEQSEQLWLGHRDRPNELLWRDPALNQGPRRGALPGGHPEGFRETFMGLFAAVYRAVAAGGPGEDYPTFRDGHRANILADAMLESHRGRRWVSVTG